MPTDVEKLRVFLKQCAIPSYYSGNWFKGASLVGSVLYVPDRDQATSIARLFGSQMKARAPGITMRATAAPETPTAAAPAYLNTAGRRAWRGEMAARQPRLSEGTE